MQIALLTLEFQLPGCGSLKEKRRRISGLRDRFGKSPQLAIAESAWADSHQRSQWTVLAMAATRGQVMQQLEQLLASVLELDAVLCEQRVEWL
ncbi:DUF503 domain-containing protein [Aestuariirhabdus sp. LZHN29]|uniref:DUF503 domain-containing protein n=1 Tax=Aestuariirhabdus sp. LZHN29 TaxID=3417462 RepID=UPI003CF91E92